MPGLPQRNVQLCNSHSSSCSAGSDFSNGIWSKHRDDITFNQLQKFWSGLSPHARQKLLRIDKQTLLEQARKNLYCSRCNGLLLEGFSQIVMYGKSLHQEGASGQLPVGNSENLKNQNDCKSNVMLSSCQDDTQDPSVHPWGGLAATRDGILTLLDCFLGAKSLKALQNVFDSARARERERELLYPDACGGGGRGWISLGMANYGRGHGTRETCALHTARLSCDTLVDFWSALGDETRRSLLRMKEEDFIERLMFRFDSKRFCRDCRRNVIREFKELKELKRMRREPRCNSWFCAADTAFEYEVSDDTVQASWYESFSDIVGTYHHFEWAIGTGEGKSDILEFEDVGMTGSVEIDGLDLSDLSACFITLRAWKLDGRCTELSVKAHAVKGQPCVHRRLVVGDGYVTISKGESIRRFFEHAEEAEEEEDDDSMDKDGNEVDGESTRPQKHAKSPELAREFLLDAATVIFKEQVEKAFREGTARQNAHSIFVCLALKLLEERVHVACKEIITLEKQSKLLEEEEKEKREEEERKERRRTKEREKKLRRKERLKGKEKEVEKDLVNQNHLHCVSNEEESSSSVHEEAHNASNSGESISETGDLALSRPLSPDIQDEQSSSSYKDDSLQNFGNGEPSSRDGGGFISSEQFNFSRRKSKARKEFQDNSPPVDDQKSNGGYTGIPPRCVNGVTKHTRSNPARSNSRNYGHNLSEKFCSCYNTQSEYRSKDGSHVTTARPNGAIRTTINRDVKKVWEPIESRKRYVRSNPDSYVASKSSTSKVDECEEGGPSNEDDSVAELQIHEPYGDLVEDKISGLKNNGKEERDSDHSNGFILGTNSSYYLKETAESCPMTNTCSVNDVSSTVLKSTSSSDNCSSCLSEADSSKASSSSTQTAESWSTSDSEDASPQSEEKQTSSRGMNDFMKYQDFEVDENHKKYQDFEVDEIHKPNGGETLITEKKTDFTPPTVDPPAQNVHLFDHNDKISMEMGLQQHQTFQSIHNTQGIQLPIFPAPSTMAYYHQNPASWSAAPVENGFMQYPHQPNHPYLFTSPFGYGVSLNQPSQYAIPYSPLQPLTTSVFNMGQVPVYQPINRSSSDEEAKNVKRVGPFQEAADAVKVEKQHPIDRPVSSNRTRPEAASANEQNGCTTRSGNVKSGNETENFSLFHFGLPTAARTGSNNPQKTSHASQVDISLDTKIEEYSLFSSGNNRTLFSFF